RLRGCRARAALAGAARAFHRDRRLARARVPGPGCREAPRSPGRGPGISAAALLRRLRGAGAARRRRQAPEAQARAGRAHPGGDALQRARPAAGAGSGGVSPVRERIQRCTKPRTRGRALGEGMSYARIRIAWPKGSLAATLDDTPTAKALVAALPLTSRAQTWAEAVYSATPLQSTLHRAPN